MHPTASLHPILLLGLAGGAACAAESDLGSTEACDAPRAAALYFVEDVGAQTFLSRLAPTDEMERIEFPHPISSPAVSPDGDRIAFLGGESGRKLVVADTANLASSALAVRFFFDDGARDLDDCTAPSWRPDGALATVCGTRAHVLSVLDVQADGDGDGDLDPIRVWSDELGREVQIGDAIAPSTPIAWNPDPARDVFAYIQPLETPRPGEVEAHGPVMVIGSAVLFVSPETAEGGLELPIFNTNEETGLVTREIPRHAAWSPDGTKLAIVTDQSVVVVRLDPAQPGEPDSALGMKPTMIARWLFTRLASVNFTPAGESIVFAFEEHPEGQPPEYELHRLAHTGATFTTQIFDGDAPNHPCDDPAELGEVDGIRPTNRPGNQRYPTYAPPVVAPGTSL